MKNIINYFLRKLRAEFPQLFVFRRLLRLYNLKPAPIFKNGHKHALLCYLSKPFKTQNHRSHSNQREVVVLANVLNELGFSVDVVDYCSMAKIDYSRYQLLIGFGSAFANSFLGMSFKGTRILHMTGANLNFSNQAEAWRAHQLRERRGVLLSPRREAYWPWMFSAINSDAIFVLGNSWTASTYEGLNDRIFQLPVPFVAPKISNLKRDFETARRRFCWFAGSGALHKGLDLILDAIDQLGDEFHLDICGPIEQEADFLEVYDKSIYGNPRVSFHGFIDVASLEMENLMLNNAFVIFPSCSEGGGSSVITCMAAGLIPVVTKEASVEIGDFGILIEYPSVAAIVESMFIASEMSRDELHHRSIKASKFAQMAHTYDAYRNEIRQAVVTVTGGVV